jgi:hypothetical protein
MKTLKIKWPRRTGKVFITICTISVSMKLLSITKHHVKTGTTNVMIICITQVWKKFHKYQASLFMCVSHRSKGPVTLSSHVMETSTLFDVTVCMQFNSLTRSQGAVLNAMFWENIKISHFTAIFFSLMSQWRFISLL